MTDRKDILNELNTISPVVAGIPFVNVFVVPQGYFNRLAESIFINTTEAENIVYPVFEKVPQGYFENLSGNIMDKIKALETCAKDEIHTLSPVLANIGNANIFTVPNSYFEHLAAELTQKCSVVTETEMISATVVSIGNKNQFTVPEGYFNKVTNNIISALPAATKVVKMQGHFRILRYAAAAVIVGLLGLLVFFNLNKNQTSVVDNSVIANAKKILKNNSFDAELATLGADVIEKYLSNNGEDVQAALGANSASENAENLPDAVDYFLDDKTLDEFLNNHNLNRN